MPTRLPLMLALMMMLGCHAPIHQGSPINHVVLIELKQDQGTVDLVSDCDTLLADIPSVRTYWCGVHGDFGRTSVDADYDVALCVGFADAAGYQAYLDHPDHVALVEKWKPHMEWIRIHDVVDE